MATKIVTKNSSTASAVPTASDLVQGELAVNVADKRLFTEDNAGAIVELGTNPSGNVTFQDNGKATFGAGSDLQIYHDGFHSIIAESGGGSLLIRGDNTYFTNSAATKGYADFIADGAVTLRYNNLAKLATTATGIDVTGTATMDGLTVDLADNAGVLLKSPNDSSTAFLKFGDSTSSDSGSISYDHFSDSLRFKTINTNRMILASNGDISFYEDTGTTPKLFWDASAESLGIGTSSPTEKLHIVGGDLGIGSTQYRENNIVSYASADYSIATSGAYNLTFKTNNAERLRIDSAGTVKISHADTASEGLRVIQTTAARTSGGSLGLFYDDQAGTTQPTLQVIQNGTGDILQLFDGGSQVVTVKDGGNVGIGTSSPAYKLDLNGDMRFTSSSALFWGDTNVYEGRTGSDRYWVTGGTERIRIDSSGNLLVGTTNYAPVSNNVVGISARGQYGELQVSTEGSTGAPLYLNRKTSDGDIAVFRKDGSTVGSIGSIASDLYIAEGNSGLRFDGENNQILPSSTTASTNGTCNLGASSARFKDLYLSGGVYLGGTGGANKLDDYEEGTFTPSFSMASGSVTYGTREAAYTKIGNTVTATVALSVASISSPSGNLTVTGFPFAAGSGERYVSSITVGIARDFTVDFASGIKGYMTSGNTNIQIAINAENAGHSAVNANTLKVGTRFYFTITYQTA